MKAFTALFDDLDSTTSTNEKVSALKKYFEHAESDDAMWTVLLLTGRISRRVITGRKLRDLFVLATDYPDWLIRECHSQVGDTAETLSLLANSLSLCADRESPHDTSLAEWMEKRIPELAAIKDPAEQAQKLLALWRDLTQSEVFIFNKLLTGAFRVGVSEKLVIRAIADLYEIPSDQVAHRLTGMSTPGRENFMKLISKKADEPTFSQPYPFCLAHAWVERTDEDWNSGEWCVEWKFDGIRAQIIARAGDVWIWSRGEEDITDNFPDLKELFRTLPQGTVLDGEIVVLRDGKVQSFNELQARLNRKKISSAILAEKPAGFIAYDCIEFQHEDVRSQSLRQRKRLLDQTLKPLWSPQIQISEIFAPQTLKDLEKLRSHAREHDSEGVMIKSWESPYVVGRKTGNWWKHKVDPLTLDAVLLYAQAGSGRRANLYTDYTFALRNQENELIPFAKAYSGLDQKEIDELDRWIRTHTKEKFGPVRSVEPYHVFEIGFEGIARSKRHKSGIAVRFPRILRWRKDKKVEDADDLYAAEALLNSNEAMNEASRAQAH